MSLPVHDVESLCQVYEDRIQIHILLKAFFLYLTDYKYHVNGTPVWAKPALCLWRIFFRDLGDETVEDGPCKNLSNNGEERYVSVISAFRLAGLVLGYGYNGGIPEVFKQPFFSPESSERFLGPQGQPPCRPQPGVRPYQALYLSWFV